MENLDLNQNQNESQETVALSDEKRVKVMSPGMLVVKRFIRNRLAVIGFVILAVMFLLSFVGPIFSPYGQTQTFNKTEDKITDYAEFAFSDSWSFIQRKGSNMGASATTKSIMTINKVLTAIKGNQEVTPEMMAYESGNETYMVSYVGDEFFLIDAPVVVATLEAKGGNVEITYDDQSLKSSEFEQAATAAYREANAANTYKGFTFTVGEAPEPVAPAEGEEPGTTEEVVVPDLPTYGITVTDLDNRTGDSKWKITSFQPACIATKLTFHAANESDVALMGDYDFAIGALNAYYGNGTNFTAAGKSYTAKMDAPKTVSNNTISQMTVSANGNTVARVSNFMLSRKAGGFLDLEFKDAVIAALSSGNNTFTMMGDVSELTEPETSAAPEGEEGEDAPVMPDEQVVENSGPQEIEYTIERRNITWAIRAEAPTLLVDTYASPSMDHILGTDAFGMDVSTRLMYGGQVSLMVGFIVVIIETAIGVVLGGIAGYFSGWVDVLIMRLIELFNCIPFYPMLMIIGSLLDAAKAGAEVRIYILMVVLGILSWPGIARIVRGQILSLREQDFMVATEASGLPIPRRIFRHLLPNVIPLLIVQATMGLGGIIITEATLSFLGLGVKDPLASWGAIINQASNQYVMTNYWWIWLPAGMLILLTVLGFNFVGDGLRDAFDPKMKR